MYIKKTALATTIGLMFSGTALFASPNSNTEYGDYNTNTQKETTVIGESNYVSKGKKSDVEFKLKEKSDLEKDTKEKKDKLNKFNDEIDENEKKAGTAVKKQKNIDNAKKQKDDAEKNKKEHDPIYKDLKDKSDNAEKFVTEKQEKLYQVLIKASKDGLTQDKIPLHADEIVKVVNEGMSGEMTITKDDAIEYLTTMRQAFGDIEPLNQFYKDSNIIGSASTSASDVLDEPSSNYKKNTNVKVSASQMLFLDKDDKILSSNNIRDTYVNDITYLLNSKYLFNISEKFKGLNAYAKRMPISKLIERMKATGNEWVGESKEIWGEYIDLRVSKINKKEELDKQVKLVAELNTKLNKDSSGNIVDDENNKLYQKAVDDRIVLSKEWESLDNKTKKLEEDGVFENHSPFSAINRTLTADLQHINDVKSGYVDKDIKIKKVIESVGNEYKEDFKKAERRKKEIDNEIDVQNKIIDENKLTEDEKKAKEEIDKLNKEKEDLDNEINDNLNKIKELGEPIGENSVVTGNKNLVLGNNTVVIGNNNETMEDNNIAIGHNNVISGIDSTSFGHNNTITGKNSTAIGSNITISSDNVVAVGSKEITRKIINMSDGEISENSKEAVNGSQLFATNKRVSNLELNSSSSEVKGWHYNEENNSVTMGKDAENTGDNSIVYGKKTFNNSENSIILGKNNKNENIPQYLEKNEKFVEYVNDNDPSETLIIHTSDIKIGNHTTTKGNNVFLDDGYKISGYSSSLIERKIPQFILGQDVNNSIIIGNNSQNGEHINLNNDEWYGIQKFDNAQDIKNYEDTILLGNNLSSKGNKSIVIGSQSENSENEGIVIGSQSNNSGIGGVAIGHNSNNNGNNSIALGEYSNVKNKESNILSIGNAVLKRKIIHVDKGIISSTSTDAINGSQLYTTTLNLAKTIDKDAKLDKDGNITNVKIEVNGNEYTNVKEAIIEAVNSSNITIDNLEKNLVIADGKNGKVMSFKTNNVTFGNIVINNNDGKISGVVGGSLNKDSTDVVVGSQLFATNENVTNNTVNITKNTGDITTINQTLSTGIFSVSANNGTPYKITKDSTVNFGSKSGSIKITQNNGSFDLDIGDILSIKEQIIVDGKKVLVEGDDVLNNIVKYDNNDKSAISLAGNSGGTVIKNVKATELTKDSTDAVNGGQLFTTNELVSKNINDIKNLTTNVEDNTKNISTNATNINNVTNRVTKNENDIKLINLETTRLENTKADRSELVEITNNLTQNLELITNIDNSVKNNINRLDELEPRVKKNENNIIKLNDEKMDKTDFDLFKNNYNEFVEKTDGDINKNTLNISNIDGRIIINAKDIEELKKNNGTSPTLIKQVEDNTTNINNVTELATNNYNKIEELKPIVNNNVNNIQILAKETERLEITKADREEVKQVVNAHSENINKIGSVVNNHDSRISKNSEDIQNLTESTSRGISAVAATSAVDFSRIKTGQVGVGAGYGYYRNSQSVAVGMAYAPNENLSINGKLGIAVEKFKDSVVSVGGTYYFD